MLTNLFVTLLGRLQDVRREEGQGLIEYALILTLVAAVTVGVLATIGGHVSDVFDSIEELF